MNNKKIRWGIIGLGNIANKFATDLASIENAQLVAVASRNQQKAAEFAVRHNSKKAYNSYEKLAKDTEVDAVYIATPHSFHKAHALLCLQHKKAVLCEKPFAMNLQEVTEMIAVAKENNSLLMEALWTFFLPHFTYVLELVKNEKLGKPDAIDASATFFENGADASCALIFHYEKATAILKSTLLEETTTEAVFTFDTAVVKINRQFHQPSSVVIIQNKKEEIINFDCRTIGYTYEIEHFNQLLRENKKESTLLTFDFSKSIIKTLDKVRAIIGLTYEC